MQLNIFQLFNKIFNTIKYNGLFIFLAIIFPIILFAFDAGKEIFRSLSEEESMLNLSLCLASSFVLGYAVWCIPTIAISIFQFMTGYDGTNVEPTADIKEQKLSSKERLFKLQASIYNDEGTVSNTEAKGDIPNIQFDTFTTIEEQSDKAQFPIRYFAIFPWLMFMVTYYFVVYETKWKIIASVLLVLLFAGGNLIFKKYHNRIQFPKKGVFFLLKCTLPFLIFLFLPYIYIAGLRQGHHEFIFPLISSIGVVIFFNTLRLLEEKHVNYKLSDFNYKCLLVVLTLTLGAFYVMNNNQLLSEISLVVILFILSAFLITVIDLFFTSQYLLIKLIKKTLSPEKDSVILLKVRLYQIVIIALPFIFVYLTLFSSTNTHRIRKSYEPAKYVSIKERTTLENYFDYWYNRNRGAIKDTIYLVSGQGGGSRAAAWFFMNMAAKEKEDRDFFKKVFSISTVSGSSVGAYMYLGAKYYHKEIKDIESVSTVLFTRNFLSSNFFGLLLGDGIDGIIDKIIKSKNGFPKDRNFYFQKEEMKAFQDAFQIGPKDFFEQDYFYLYQDTSRRFPLFLINTTIVDKGTQGIFSPVTLEGISLARDLYKDFKNDDCNGNYNIPMTTCVNQSEAFPLASAYNFMDGVGRFIDGGLYENTGCATTLEIYQALRKFLYFKKDSAIRNLKVVLYNITNASVSEDHSISYNNASILNSLTALTNSPFGGHQNFAIHNLSRQVDYFNNLGIGVGRDTVINIPLNESVTLTRCLSESTIRQMYLALKNETSK